MKRKIDIPTKEKKTSNFTIRFSASDRKILDEFCLKKNTTLTALIRYSLEIIMERAK